MTSCLAILYTKSRLRNGLSKREEFMSLKVVPFHKGDKIIL